MRRGPGKVDGTAPGCDGEQEPALNGGGVLGGVRAWGLEGVEKNIAAVRRGSSCELFGAGVGGGECSSAECATSQTAGARTSRSPLETEEHGGRRMNGNTKVRVAISETRLPLSHTGKGNLVRSHRECEAETKYIWWPGDTTR